MLLKSLLVAFFRSRRCRRALYLWLFLVTTQHAPGPSPDPADGSELPAASAALIVPVLGVGALDLRDSFREWRGGGRRRHFAIDISAPRRTPVLAVDSGTIVKLHRYPLAGITVHQLDVSGRYSFMYAHLERYRKGLREGDIVRQGDIIGYVGSTGNATSPHLHFAIREVNGDRRWWRGEPVNPYPLLRQGS